MAQVQCPNCGAYRVESVPGWVHRDTGRPLKPLGPGRTVFGALLAVGMTWAGLNFGLWFLIPGLFFLVYIPWNVVHDLQQPKMRAYRNACWICGYRWEQRDDRPLPEVQLRADVIEKGSRLNEEATARQQAEADWFHYRQLH